MEEESRPDTRLMYFIHCSVCGRYEASDEIKEALNRGEFTDEQRALLSGVLRNAHERKERPQLTTHTVHDLLKLANPPRTLHAGLNRVLTFVYDKLTRPSGAVALDPSSDYSLFYFLSPEEFSFYVEQLVNLGWLERVGSEVRLTLDGWTRVEELGLAAARSNQAFVAMWFDTELDPAWTDGIRPALEAAGYEATRVDQIEHNERIDDRIISEIRRSALVVADFSGHRGGVYFEAGFALGLRIPVIWTCRKSEIDASHFDTRQYNHIVWEEPADLKESLLNRVRATIPERGRDV